MRGVALPGGEVGEDSSVLADSFNTKINGLEGAAVLLLVLRWVRTGRNSEISPFTGAFLGLTIG